MSLKPEVLDALVAAGASAEMIVAALRADAAEADARKQARRDGTRVRMRRLRASRGKGPEEGVTGDECAPESVTPRHESVTGRHTPVPPSSPHTPQQPPYPQTTREARTAREAERLRRQLTEAAGPALDPMAKGVQALSDPLSWLASGADLVLDIVPTIRARAGPLKPRSLRTWGYFTRAVADARDRRLARLPPPGQPIEGRPYAFDPSRKGDPNVPTTSDLLRGTAAQLRAEEAPGSGDGAGGAFARLLSGSG